MLGLERKQGRKLTHLLGDILSNLQTVENLGFGSLAGLDSLPERRRDYSRISRASWVENIGVFYELRG